MAADEWKTLLSEHGMRQKLLYPEGRPATWTLVCRCNDWITNYEFDDRSEEQHEAFNAHLAAVLEARVQQREAAAWVAGVRQQWAAAERVEFNPYRADRIEEGT